MVFLAEIRANGKVKNVIRGSTDTIEPLFQRDTTVSSKFATIWASYIFVFIAVLITFSIVFAIGFVVNAAAYDGTTKVTSKMFNPPYQLFNEHSYAILQKAREHLRRTPFNTTSFKFRQQLNSITLFRHQ